MPLAPVTVPVNPCHHSLIPSSCLSGGGLGDSPPGLFGSSSGLAGRKAGPPQVRPGLSEGLEGMELGGRRQRLSLLDDLQEEEVRYSTEHARVTG